MPKKPKKTREEKSAENYFPVEEDFKKTTEKIVKDSLPERKRLTEKVVKSVEDDTRVVEKKYKKPVKRQKIERKFSVQAVLPRLSRLLIQSACE